MMAILTPSLSAFLSFAVEELRGRLLFATPPPTRDRFPPLFDALAIEVVLKNIELLIL